MAGRTQRELYLNVSGSTSELNAAMKAGKSALLGLGDAANDVQAEVNKALGDMARNPNTLKELEASYARTFANIRRNAQSVVDAPTPQAAMQILDVSGAQQAAAAKEASAAGLRMDADAAAAVAARYGYANAAVNTLTATLEANAIVAAQEAAALRAQAGIMAEVGAEVRAAGGAMAEGSEEVAAGHARMGASGMIAQHVVRSFSDSVAAGQSPLRAGTMELGRISEAMSLFAMETNATEGALGKFAGFMGGPWGLAFSFGIGLVGTLASSMLEGGEAAKTDADAHDALKEAMDRMNGAAAALNHTTRQGIVDDLNAAEAARKHEIAVRGLLAAQLEGARQKMADANVSANVAGGGTVPGASGMLGALAAASAREQITAIEGAQKLNAAKLAAATSAIGVQNAKLIQRAVEAGTDPRSAIKQRFEDRADTLERKFEGRGYGDPRSKAAQVAYQADLASATHLRDSANDALKPHHERRTRRPRADHTVERAANVDRAYQGELDQAQDRYAKAQLALSDTAEGRLKVSLDELRAGKVQRDSEIADQLTAKKLTPAEATRLKVLNADTEALEEQKATRDEQQAILDRQLATDRQRLDAGMALLRLQASFATSSAERRRIGLQALAGEEKGQRQDAQRDIASNDPDRVAKGKASLASIDEQHPYRQRQVEEDTANPLESYGSALRKNVGNMNDALGDVKVDALKGLEDGLLGILNGTKSVAAGFKEMAASVIADIEKIAIEKLILSFIPGLKDGGSVLHLAGGGAVFGPGGPREDRIPAMLSAGEYVVNAAAYARHPELVEAINTGKLPGFADGGLVAPNRIYMRALPSPASVSRAQGGDIVQHFHVNAQGAVLAADLRSDMQRIGIAAAIGGSQQAQQDIGDRQMAQIP